MGKLRSTWKKVLHGGTEFCSSPILPNPPAVGTEHNFTPKRGYKYTQSEGGSSLVMTTTSHDPSAWKCECYEECKGTVTCEGVDGNCVCNPTPGFQGTPISFIKDPTCTLDQATCTLKNASAMSGTTQNSTSEQQEALGQVQYTNTTFYDRLSQSTISSRLDSDHINMQIARWKQSKDPDSWSNLANNYLQWQWNGFDGPHDLPPADRPKRGTNVNVNLDFDSADFGF